MPNPPPPLILYSNFNISNFKIENFKDTPITEIAKIKYNYGTVDNPIYDNLNLILSTIKHEYGGIPPKGLYYPNALSRAHFELSFCHADRAFPTVNYGAIEDCYNVLKSIDIHCGSENFKKQIFGKNANVYDYQQIIKEPQDEKPYHPPLVKIKLGLNFDKDIKELKPNYKIFRLVGGIRQEVLFEAQEDIEHLLRFRCDLKFIVSFNNLFVMKTKNPDGKKIYGINLRSIEIETDTTDAD